MITVTNLSYNVGSKRILDNLSFNISKGKFCAILGPNGAGKSSLLKCMTGAISPSEGWITIDDDLLTEQSAKELSKRRAVLSQSHQVNFPFTVKEIIEMGRHPHIVGKETTYDKHLTEELLHKLEASDLQDRLYSTLSGGEQQRIQFARVLAQIWDQKDAFLFLDEPTAALDLKHQIHLLDIAKDIARERNFTIIAILHDLNLSKLYADQFLFLKNGSIFKNIEGSESFNQQDISTLYDVPTQFIDKLYNVG